MSARLIGNYKLKIKSKFGLDDIIIVTINDTLDAIVQLDDDSRAMLLEILQKRQIERRRNEIAANGKKAKAAYKSPKIVPDKASKIICSLNAPVLCVKENYFIPIICKGL